MQRLGNVSESDVEDRKVVRGRIGKVEYAGSEYGIHFIYH